MAEPSRGSRTQFCAIAPARYGRGAFWADDPVIRSIADRWIDWAQTTLQHDVLGGVFWGFYRAPGPQRDMPAVADKIARCARHATLLDEALADRPYLGGHDLTLADIPAETSLYRYFGLDIARPAIPLVEAWYRRLGDHTAYRQHVMMPFETLWGRLNY